MPWPRLRSRANGPWCTSQVVASAIHFGHPTPLKRRASCRGTMAGLGRWRPIGRRKYNCLSRCRGQRPGLRLQGLGILQLLDESGRIARDLELDQLDFSSNGQGLGCSASILHKLSPDKAASKCRRGIGASPIRLSSADGASVQGWWLCDKNGLAWPALLPLVLACLALTCVHCQPRSGLNRTKCKVGYSYSVCDGSLQLDPRRPLLNISHLPQLPLLALCFRVSPTHLYTSERFPKVLLSPS